MDAAGSRRAAMATTAEAGPMACSSPPPGRSGPAPWSRNASAGCGRRRLPDRDPAGARRGHHPGRGHLGDGRAHPTAIPSRAGDERSAAERPGCSRSIASPRTVHLFLRALFAEIGRPLLPLVQAPTLVLHRRDFPAPARARALQAEHIPNARLVVLPSADGP